MWTALGWLLIVAVVIVVISFVLYVDKKEREAMASINESARRIEKLAKEQEKYIKEIKKQYGIK